MRPHRCFACSLVLALSTPLSATADHVVWFNPTAPKFSGFSTLGTPPTPEAIRIQSNSAQPQSGTVMIPLSIRNDAQIDSLIVCLQTSSGDVGPSSITGIVLRGMWLPSSTTTWYSDAIIRQSLTGQCVTLDVQDVTPTAAPEVAISYSLNTQTFVDIGAIGIRLKGPAALGVAGPAEIHESSLRMAPNRPDPFSPPTRIEYSVAAAQHVRVQVYDISGRAVRTLVDRDTPAGSFAELWDGRDDAGNRLSPGVYYARVSGNGIARSDRMVMLR